MLSSAWLWPATLGCTLYVSRSAGYDWRPIGMALAACCALHVTTAVAYAGHWPRGSRLGLALAVVWLVAVTGAAVLFSAAAVLAGAR